MYDGVFRARELLSGILTGEYPAALIVVGAEQGLVLDGEWGQKADGSAAVMTEAATNYSKPCAEIMGPESEGVDSSTTGIVTPLGFWILVTDQDADPAALDVRLACHLTTLVRVLGWRQVLGSSGHTCRVTRITTAPPGQTQGDTWVGGVGVQVVVTTMDSLT